MTHGEYEIQEVLKEILIELQKINETLGMLNEGGVIKVTPVVSEGSLNC